jgi:ubiquinone/menaquinone biosynthesis C-methylase UbiE
LRTIIEIIESYYAANVLMKLNETDFFENISEKKLIKQYFPNRSIYHFIKQSTDIIESEMGNFFTINPNYSQYATSGFHIDKFLGAYGQFKVKAKAPQIIMDEKKFAAAFDKASYHQTNHHILQLLSQLGVKTLLDLGCGTGKLLIDFCEQSKQHKAFGIEQNVHLLPIVKKQIKQNKLSASIKLIKGNVTNFNTLLKANEQKSIDAIYGASILNEFFQSPTTLVQFLKNLKKTFAGKFFIVVDYYGILNTKQAAKKNKSHNYVHDVMQVLSGQGVPPSTKNDWDVYYKKAGCKLILAHEAKNNSINWFIHVIKL